MAVNWDLYETRILFNGSTRRDRYVENQINIQEKFMADSPAYSVCTIDETESHLVFLNGKIPNSKEVHTLPSEKSNLKVGNIIGWNGSNWLVTSMDFNNEIDQAATIVQCNITIRFQTLFDGDYDIYEQVGIIDPGVYSTTEKTYPEMTLPDQQFKLILPYNDVVAKLYASKRLAVSRWIDENNSPVIIAFRITSVDPMTDNYGNGNIVTFKLRQEQYVPPIDDLTNMVCDYVAAAPTGDGGSWI